MTQINVIPLEGEDVEWQVVQVVDVWNALSLVHVTRPGRTFRSETVGARGWLELRLIDAADDSVVARSCRVNN